MTYVHSSLSSECLLQKSKFTWYLLNLRVPREMKLTSHLNVLSHQTFWWFYYDIRCIVNHIEYFIDPLSLNITHHGKTKKKFPAIFGAYCIFVYVTVTCRLILMATTTSMHILNVMYLKIYHWPFLIIIARLKFFYLFVFILFLFIFVGFFFFLNILA